jgi:hypothetical protein
MLMKMDIMNDVLRLVGAHPAVASVELTGSRARGDTHALSDWDFAIQASDYRQAVDALPSLLAPLDPLAMQWDPLGEHPTFMLMLAGGVKVDLIFFHERLEARPPWKVTGETLQAIDEHFWDWILWLAGKQLKGSQELVDAELEKLQGYLLGPLGVATQPASIDEAVHSYVTARERREREVGRTVPRRIGDEVQKRLRTAL